MINKICRKIIKWFFLLVNLFTLPLFFLILSIFFLIIKIKKNIKNDVALFIGLEHVISKTIVRADQLKKIYKVIFFSFETNKSPHSNYPIIKSHKFIVLDLIRFGNILIKNNPKYCEIYFEGNCFRQFFQTILLNNNNTMIVTILRGELYYYNSSMNTIKKYFLIRILNIVDWIYYRETYMLEILKKTVKNQDKIVFDFNKVKVFTDCDIKRDKKTVLFLNGFKNWRRLDIIINALPKIIDKVKDVNFVFIGARSKSELEKYKSQIPEKYENNVRIMEWTSNSKKYYENASIFVLPADLVYLNFSLLEAMERGVPAIVANVPDVEKIIKNNVDGIITEQNSNSFADAIISLLQDEKTRLTLAFNARDKIVNNFNDKNRMDSIIEKISDRYDK